MVTQTAKAFVRRLGPGLITGAADDDPSGIATYSQAGSQFRFALVWTLLITTPLMIGIQMLSARIGWVTAEGLATNINKMCPRWLTTTLITLLVVANTINIAADVGAMGEAARLLMGGPLPLYVLGFGAFCIAMQVFFSYESTVRILKWLTLALFSYVAVILTVQVPWHQALTESLQPWLYFPKDTSLKDYSAMVVAMLGTTISPYLFFWQASQEVEDNNRRPEAQALRLHPEYAAEHLSRIKQDTFVGMTFSNVIALCIVLATAVTLNAKGITSIQTASQAAEALRQWPESLPLPYLPWASLARACSRCRCWRARRRMRSASCTAGRRACRMAFTRPGAFTSSSWRLLVSARLWVIWRWTRSRRWSGAPL